MRRHWAIYKVFIRSSFNRELEFRANFIAKVFQNIVWMLFFIAIVKIIYLNTSSVAGWSEGESYVLSATLFFMNAFFTGFLYFNLMEIPEKVRKGTLDFDVVKPIDPQFLLSLRKFNFNEVGTLITGIAMMVIGGMMAKISPGFLEIVSYVYLVLCSITIFYSWNLFLSTTGVWFVRVDNIWVLGETLFTLARYPLDIFGHVGARLLTYMVPLGFIATIPARALLGRGSPTDLIWATAWAVAFYIGSRQFLKLGLRNYSSASS